MTRDLFDIMSGNEPSRFSGDDEVTQKVKLHDFEMVLHYDTGKAVLVSDTGEEARAVWLPKSEIEIYRESRTCQGTKQDGQRVVLPVVAIVIPEWLAKDKGLI